MSKHSLEKDVDFVILQYLHRLTRLRSPPVVSIRLPIKSHVCSDGYLPTKTSSPLQ